MHPTQVLRENENVVFADKKVRNNVHGLDYTCGAVTSF